MKTLPKNKSIKRNDLIEARDRLFELKEVQNKAREEELKIRTYLADKLHTAEEGSKTFEIEGIKVTIGRTLYRTISQEEADEFCKLHGDLALECIRWKPEVKVSGYKKNQEILDPFITTKPAPATVEFK